MQITISLVVRISFTISILDFELFVSCLLLFFSYYTLNPVYKLY